MFQGIDASHITEYYYVSLCERRFSALFKSRRVRLPGCQSQGTLFSPDSKEYLIIPPFPRDPHLARFPDSDNGSDSSGCGAHRFRSSIQRPPLWSCASPSRSYRSLGSLPCGYGRLTSLARSSQPRTGPPTNRHLLSYPPIRYTPPPPRVHQRGALYAPFSLFLSRILDSSFASFGHSLSTLRAARATIHSDLLQRNLTLDIFGAIADVRKVGETHRSRSGPVNLSSLTALSTFTGGCFSCCPVSCGFRHAEMSATNRGKVPDAPAPGLFQVLSCVSNNSGGSGSNTDNNQIREYKRRRPHKKTRAGCLGCKQRRVKVCDMHPRPIWFWFCVQSCAPCLA